MRIVILGWLLLARAAFAGPELQPLCGRVFMVEGELSLNANERVMVCGSPSGLEGWREVPLPQAEYQIRILLQRRGYFFAKFQRDGDRLKVWTGPIQRVKKFSVVGSKAWLHPGRKRHVIGQALTSDLLDEISNWATRELREQGFACPSVDVKAQAWDGEILVEVQSGPRMRIGRWLFDLQGLEPQTLIRYQAAETGEWYDSRDKDLTVARLLADGLFQSASIAESCRGDRVDLTLQSSVGPTESVRVGLGASTEELPFADLAFRSAKLDRRASSFTSSLHASPRAQSLNLDAELYWLPLTRTTFLAPRFEAERSSERQWEDLQSQLGLDLGRKWDLWSVRWSGKLGPTVNYLNTVRGIGPEDVKYLSWEGHLSGMSHSFELDARNQFEGWASSLDYRGQREGLGSPLNADRFDLEGKYFWNLRDLDPPLFVFATRAQASSVVTNSLAESLGSRVLPREYRIFMGGDDNLRGWHRKTLDNRGQGYLTSLYLGFELRLIEELPYKLQPLLLWDLARFGTRSLTLEETTFSSAGIGLRWASVFGTLRGSAARGQILNAQANSPIYPEDWVYFFSFGQEF